VAYKPIVTIPQLLIKVKRMPALMGRSYAPQRPMLNGQNPQALALMQNYMRNRGGSLMRPSPAQGMGMIQPRGFTPAFANTIAGQTFARQALFNWANNDLLNSWNTASSSAGG
jgi:hypothetical protein